MPRQAGRFLLLAALLVGLFVCVRVAVQPPKEVKVNPPAPVAEVSPPVTKPEPKPDPDKKVFFDRPSVRPSLTSIKIFKKDRLLELYADGELTGRFRIALGSAPVGDKNKEGDMRTPEGAYYICTRNDRSRFTLFLGLSYPGTEDAERGLSSGLIDRSTLLNIKSHIDARKQPPWNTPLGGAVGIHGGGASTDWTFGCIAMSDEDIRIIWEYTPLKTPVEIYP